MSTVSIRRLDAADREVWRRLWTGYLDFYLTTLDEAVFDVTFERLLSEEVPQYNGLIAHVDGRPAGLVHYIFHLHGWKLADVCYLQDLWTEPGFRRHGVGEALIRAVYAAADTAGAPDVYWLTAEDNATARRLYDRVGRKTPFLKYQRP